MAQDQKKLKGPDLAAGISADSLQPGGKLLGHARGEPVLLARVGHQVFAIGATCSHYGGPLAEGVLYGETVRCPWHHACFSLRTGEALRAPALNPVACWRVEHRGDLLVVTGKLERDPLAAVAETPDPAVVAEPEIGRVYEGPVKSTTPWDEAMDAAMVRNIVIVGAGAAGAAAAEMLRRRGFGGSVFVVDSDPDAPYDRPNLSKDYLAGNAPEEWIPLRPAGFWAKHQIELVQARATRLDLVNRRLELEGDDPLRYDRLLLATGAEPIRLDLPGADLPQVHYLRSLADSRAIIAKTGSARQAVVIGGSFIGLEVAASLVTRGLAVHVVAPEALPLERVLGKELGSFIKSLHEEKGVVFHLGHKPARIERDAVVLDDGSRIAADLVVIGVGVRPRLGLAEAAGLTLDRGVVVDQYLETSAPGVFAAGDIARWPDPHSGERIRVEHWVVAERMGQAAARNLLWPRQPFTDVPFFWSAHYDVSINYVGHAEKWDAVRVDGAAERRDVAVRFDRGGKLLALATVSRDHESLRTELAMEQTVTP